MVLCRTFHTAPEQGQGLTPIVPHCSGSGPETRFNVPVPVHVRVPVPVPVPIPVPVPVPETAGVITQLPGEESLRARGALVRPDPLSPVDLLVAPRLKEM